MMETLKFRVTVVPTVDNLETVYIELKSLVISCNLNPLEWNVLHSKNDDNDHDKILDELTIETECSVKGAVPLLNEYKRLCKYWLFTVKAIAPRKRPVISFYDDQSFIRKRIPCHKVDYFNLSLGTLPWPSLYISYFQKHSIGVYSAHFYHDIRLIQINCDSSVQLEIHYSSIRKLGYAEKDGRIDLYLDLLNPPLIFMEEIRHTRYMETYTIRKRWHTFSSLDSETLGKASVIRITLEDTSQAQEIISRLHFRCNKLPVQYIHMDCIDKWVPSTPHVDLGHFGCTYLLTAIITRNYVLIEQNANIQFFLSEMKSLTCNATSLEKALTEVLYAVDSGKMLDYRKVIYSLYEWFNCKKLEDEHYIMPENHYKVRRLFITPTRKLLWPPDLVCGNRVLRNFDPDFILRVSFREDNLSRLSYNAQYCKEAIFNYAIKIPMNSGIDIGDRHYEFLAWSNSQIRDHGVYMYATNKNYESASSIRKWMGNFSHIRSVSKYMARMGQCFSQTQAMQFELSKESYVTEPDIIRGLNPLSRKPYCFSDGIGRISGALAREVNKALDIPKEQSRSAFQIRYKGFKGMLVTDPTLKNPSIVFRDSMKKFESEASKLEIARTSQPVRLYLNRQIITILGQKGVPARVFLKLQEEMLRCLTDILLNEEKAAYYLTSHSPFSKIKFKDVAQSGIGLTQEPFFRSMLLSIHRQHVEGIRCKARLAIEPNEGRNMLGVLDETSILKYGEVFVQYTTDILEVTSDKTIHRGPVVVTKNPCLHPGDVRLFLAVDVPTLHHIVDCIVFPQTGARPHPDEMAGSDLDGDEYSVLWKKEFIVIRNEIPMDFPSPPENILTSSIQVKDMIDFLTEYIKNDQIGVFANAHLVHADLQRQGIRSTECLSIARKFSIIVDFAKTGISETLSHHERPQKYPDFMERGGASDRYNSSKSLGKLYRVCQNFDTESEYANQIYADNQVDPCLVFPGWKRYEQQALNSRDKYFRLLKHLMQHYGVKHEGEIFSGAFSRLHSRYLQRNDKAEVEKVIISSVKALWKNMRNEFLEEFSNDSVEAIGTVPEMCTAIDQKASAWYIVTYREKSPFSLSFPWILSDFLSAMKIKRLSDEGNFIPLQSPTIFRLDKMLLNASIINQLDSHSCNIRRTSHNIGNNSHELEIALSVLIHWAEEKGIIYSSEGQRKRGFLYLNVLINLFYHVMDKTDHVEKNSRKELFKETKCAAFYCLHFLKYCVTLRFLDKVEANRILPFFVFRYKDLARHAMLTYHSIAVSGSFHSLGLTISESAAEEIEMRPVSLPANIKYSCPLDKMETCLKEWSGVTDIHFRSITGRNRREFLVVSASGTASAILHLEMILQKEVPKLTQCLVSDSLYLEEASASV